MTTKQARAILEAAERIQGLQRAAGEAGERINDLVAHADSGKLQVLVGREGKTKMIEYTGSSAQKIVAYILAGEHAERARQEGALVEEPVPEL